MKLFRNFQVKKLVKEISPDIKVKFGKRLECEPTEETIYIAYKTNQIDRDTFMEYVKEINSKCHFDDITLGILHEIGHIMTHCEELEEDYNFCVNLLSEMYKSKLIDDFELNRMYVRLDLESEATKWAVDFAMNNQEFAKRLAKVIGVM